MREKKYIEFLQNFEFPRERARFVKNVKYRILDETPDKYVVSKTKNITFSKSKEGEQYITGKI